MQWKDFRYGGRVYELQHLAPFTLQFDRAAEKGKPAIVYTVDVVFSLHCFTSKFPDELFDPKLKYADARETRMFDFDRYELSKRLPEIVRTLDHRRCLHTGHGNFVTIDIVTDSGETRSYHVFFELSKSGKKRAAEPLHTKWLRSCSQSRTHGQTDAVSLHSSQHSEQHSN